MVALPDIDVDPTLEAMHRAVEARAMQEPRRKYLGASGIGHECERNIWYGYNQYPREPISYKGIYAIEDGHNAENLIASRLRLVPGIQLWTENEDGSQFGFEKLDGEFKGHIDGVILGLLQAPKTLHIWEHKSVNERKFNEMTKLKEKFGEKNALREWDYTYFAQAQIYMQAFDMTRHYLTVSTPGGRDLVSCRTEYEKQTYDAMMAKAERIIRAKEPPARITTRKEFLTCKWCPFREECWKDA